MVDIEFDELKREFLAEAEEKAREIAGALDGERSPEAMERLAYLAHQLKGSGGSYGYQRISSEAAAIETAAEEMLKGSDDGLASSLEEHIGMLRAEIETRSKELGSATP